MEDNIVELEHSWFNGNRGCVGIVFAFDRKLEIYHGYIGIGDGHNETADVRSIINHGCRLTRRQTFEMIRSESARKLIESIPNERWKND